MTLSLDIIPFPDDDQQIPGIESAWVQSGPDIGLGGQFIPNKKVSSVVNAGHYRPAKGLEVALMYFEASDYGKWGNSVGVEFFTQQESTTTPPDMNIVNEQGGLLFTGRLHIRPTPSRKGIVQETISGARDVTVAYKKGLYDPITTASIEMSRYPEAYADDGVAAGTAATFSPLSYADFILGNIDFTAKEDGGTLYGYRTLVEYLLADEFNARLGGSDTDYFEIDGAYAYLDGSDTPIGGTFDATGRELNPCYLEDPRFTMGVYDEETETWSLTEQEDVDAAVDLIDVFGARTKDGIPLWTTAIDNNDIRFLEGNPHYLLAGQDGATPGTLKLDDYSSILPGQEFDVYDIRVEDEILRFYDIVSEGGRSLLDRQKYNFSCIYDSGFDMNVKLAIPSWMGYRQDVHVTVCTSIAGEGEISVDEEIQRATMIYTRVIAGIPESEYFGTEPCRAVLLMQTGQLLNDVDTGFYPMSFELAQKRAAMMGAGNGRANRAALYTEDGLNTISHMKNVTNTYMRLPVRMQAWGAGLNYAQSRNYRDYFYAGLQTVYSVKNSVLTSELTMQIAVDVTKISEDLWVQLTNNQTMTQDELIVEWNKRMLDQTNGRYAGLVTIEPDAYVDPMDRALGYSWNGRTYILANIAKQVQRTQVVLRRRVA